MRHFGILGVAWVFAGAACLAAPATAPSSLPTMDEIHTRFGVGDYDGVLRAINHLTSLGGKAAEGLDKHELLTTRGEALLRLKQPEAAAMAFHQASKATDDPDRSAVDLATEILIRHAKQSEYVPKPVSSSAPKPAPLSIIAPDKRKLALRALFSDEWATAAPSLKAAKTADSLVVIANAAKLVRSLQLDLLDRVANGNDDQTRQSVTGLRDHAAELMSKALEKLGKREQEITSSANEIIHQQVMTQGPQGLQPTDLARRRGLQGADRQDLQMISRTASQIAVAAREIVAGLGDKTAADDLAEQANDIIQRATKAINADYSHA